MDVGVRELKARLSEFLDRAAEGERIRVTERGKPKALLGPLPGTDNIERGIREGWITPAKRPGALARRGRRRFTIDTTVQELLDEDRADRFD